MHYIGTLTTYVLALTATLAVTASSATANPVEVINEATGEHCAGTNCAPTIIGTVSIRDGAMNVMDVCTTTINATFEEDGSAAATASFLEGFACYWIRNCEAAPERIWEIQPIEEVGANEYGTEIRICLLTRNVTGGIVDLHCNLSLHIEEDPTNAHHYILMPATGHHGPEAAEWFCLGGGFLNLDSLEIDGGPAAGAIEILH